MSNENTLVSEATIVRTFEPKPKKVQEILFDKELHRPAFQRQYKWTPKHVNQLIEDIVVHFHKKIKTYRIGTAVFYFDDSKQRKEIVDGQQRLITLSLIAHALLTGKNTREFASRFGTIEGLTLLTKCTFTGSITKENVAANYQEIVREVSNFSNDEIRFFFENCELVCITRQDITEAFQFFDSQNARGKDLDPHDLLKAYHLREMAGATEEEIKELIETWENEKDDDLNELFGQYLFRIRRWAKRRSARFLTKANADVFKGVSLRKVNNYAYVYPLKISDVYTDEFNSHPHRKIDEVKKDFPFQVDQVIINGRRFFEMTSYYQQTVKKFKAVHKSAFKDGMSTEEEAKEIRSFLDKLEFLDITDPSSINYRIFKGLSIYEGRQRQGDQYARVLFDAALIYYTDKFGNADLERVIPKIFIWAYRLRLDQQSLQLASADTYAMSSESMFNVIREATEPKNVYQAYIVPLDEAVSTKTAKIEQLFIELKYLRDEQSN